MSCRKAEEFLGARGVPYRRRDYFRDRFTRQELADLLDRAGLTPREVLSTRSRAYRELGLAERELSDEELLDLMAREPTLLRRPLIVSERGVVVGFDRRRLEELAR
ncbi:MAG: Spx/MgsR family RNA polymerase-binding regulatory protein [Thermomicrobiaceae bacterium]|nr:Spx/MgsR family RNA polymerase-binding regulatory protein [Thermomicrobiaceae bacterium]